MKIQRKLTLPLINFCIICLLGAGGSAQRIESPLAASGPIPVETAVSALSFAPSPIAVSRDGQWVAYSLSDPTRTEPQGRPSDQLNVFTCSGAPSVYSNTDIWVANTKSATAKNLTGGRGANWGPSWSPDGEFLAFYSDRTGRAHIWLWDRSSDKLRQLSNVVVHVLPVFEPILWSRDGKRVVTKIVGEGQILENCVNGSQAGLASGIVVYDEQEDRNLVLPRSTTSFIADLAIINVMSGKANRLIRQQKIVGYSLSPDDARIVFSSPKQRKPNDAFLLLYDLVVISIERPDIRTIAPFSPGVPSLPVSWSPNGRLLAYTSGGDCFFWTANDGQTRKVAPGPKSGFRQKPLWDREGQSVYMIADNKVWRVSSNDAKAVSITSDWDRQTKLIVPGDNGNTFGSSEDGHSLCIGTTNLKTKQDGFFRVDLRTGNRTKIIEDDWTYDTGFNGVSQQGDVVIFAAQNAQHEQNLWVANRDFSHTSQLTHINPRLEKYSVGKTQLIEYADANGVKLHATLLLPVNHRDGQRHPLIVWVYGGSMLSNYLNRYGSTPIDLHNMQLLATRGYAVVLPDTPLKVGTPMADLMTTVLPAIDKVIEMGIADREKLGVMGVSYGGYSTLALIVQTSRFKAAVMDTGFGNLSSSYGVMLKSGLPLGVGWAEEGQGRMGGPPWQFRDRYVQNSPVFYLDKVQTPLLITQGGMDVTDFQSDEIFVGLRRLGKKVTYVRYEQEGHGLRGFVNKIDYWNRVIAWFDLHLDTRRPIAQSYP